MHHYPHSIQNLPLFIHCRSSPILISVGLEGAEVAPALCLLVIAGPRVASRQRLLSVQPQKDTGSRSSSFSHTLRAVVQSSTWYGWRKNAHVHRSTQTHTLSCSCRFVAMARCSVSDLAHVNGLWIDVWACYIVLDLNKRCLHCDKNDVHVMYFMVWAMHETGSQHQNN